MRSQRPVGWKVQECKAQLVKRYVCGTRTAPLLCPGTNLPELCALLLELEHARLERLAAELDFELSQRAAQRIVVLLCACVRACMCAHVCACMRGMQETC